MFDEIRYSRPQIEDVELGYRLRQRGRRIVLDPGVRGRHLKRWTIPGIVRTDLLQRGIPWVRLLLERGPAAARGPSLGAREILSVGLIGTAVLLLLTSVVAARRVELAAAAVLCLGASVAVSSPFHLWIWKKRGARVGLASIPLYLLYHLISVAAVVAGSVVFLFRDAPPIAISGGQQDGAAPSRSFAGFAAGEAGSRALAFIATAYIARKLGVSAFGYLGFATAVVAYFGTALSAGISEVGSREVARHPRDAQTIAAGATLIRLVAAVIALAGVIAISMVVPEPRLGRVVLALTGLSLISLALDTSWVYKGFGKSRRVGAGLLLGQSLAVGLLLLLVRAPENVVRVPIIQFFADVVAAAFLITPLLGRAWLSPRISEAIGLVKSSGLITLSRILRTLIVTIDVVLLGIMTSSEQVGLYSAAYRIVFFVMAIAYASHVAWLPAVTRTIAGRRPVDTVFAGSLRLSLAVTLPFVVGGLMIAPQLLRAIFGEEYSPAATALRLLLVSLFFIALHGASRNLFLAYERLGIETWIMAAGVVVNVGLNLALIPRYGLNGAALATAAADGVILILCVVAVARFGIRPSLWLLVVPLAAGGAMAVGLWLIGLDRPAVISIMVGAIIYGGALAVLTHLSRGWQTVQLSPAADAVQ